MLHNIFLFFFILKNKFDVWNNKVPNELTFISKKMQEYNAELINITDYDIAIIQNISLNSRKLELLNKLTNKNISEITKLDLINKYQMLEKYNLIKKFQMIENYDLQNNILVGELMKDIYFL